MKTTEDSLSSIVATHLAEGGELLATLFEEDGMNEASGLALVNWFGRFQCAIEKTAK